MEYLEPPVLSDSKLLGDEVISRLMVQNVRNPGLSQVYARLLTDAGGSEILFCNIAAYDLEAGEYTFADLQRAADTRGEIAIGLRRVGDKGAPQAGVSLNPRRDEHLRLNEGDELIVLSTYG